jgi:hypothetical protein
MLKNWIGVLTREPGAAVFATLLFVGIVFGLDHWHQAWLDPEVENWYNLQSEIIKSIIFFTGCFVSYAVSWIVVILIVAPINYALDPIYAKERELDAVPKRNDLPR